MADSGVPPETRSSASIRRLDRAGRRGLVGDDSRFGDYGLGRARCPAEDSVVIG